MKKICFITLGCPKNIADTEQIISVLASLHITITDVVADADVIVLNTCGFVQSAIEENYQYINELQKIKQQKPALQIIVYGCLVSRMSADIKQLESKFPKIDKFLPIMNVEDLISLITNKSVLTNRVTHLTTSQFYSYLKISDGCNRKCSFCTIPSIKGKYQSVPMNLLLNKAQQLVTIGNKEVILIGQETTCYGNDINCNFVTLLDKLSQIEKLQWIRIMYSHPHSFDNRILRLMNERGNICKYIDIPLQHISDSVLKSMQRPTNSIQIKELINTMKNVVPNIRIRSTFIVGFPGETKKDFKELQQFLAEYELDRVGIFKYSAEKGTESYNLPKQVSQSIKDERFAELMEQQQSISLKKNRQLIGQKINVLVEEKTESGYTGRTEFDAPDIDNAVIIQKRNGIKLGAIQPLKVKDCSEYDLFC